VATKTIICDTDVMIDYWNKYSLRHFATKELLEKVIELDNVVLSAITKMELLMGAKDKEGLVRINKKISQFKIILIDNAITESAIQLLQNYRLSHGLALPDAFIAATCNTLELKLFTHNIKDYKFIDDLVLFN